LICTGQTSIPPELPNVRFLRDGAPVESLHIKQEIIDEDPPVSMSFESSFSTFVLNTTGDIPVANEPLEEEEVDNYDSHSSDEDQRDSEDIIRIQDLDGNNIVCVLPADIGSYLTRFDTAKDSFSPTRSHRAPFASPVCSEGSSGGRSRKRLDTSWESSCTDVSVEIDKRRNHGGEFGEMPGSGTGSGVPEFPCELCNYCGRSQNCLNKHYQAHAHPGKICQICHKAFERHSDLLRHEEKHRRMNELSAEDGMNPRRRTCLSSSRSPKKKRVSSSGELECSVTNSLSKS